MPLMQNGGLGLKVFFLMHRKILTRLQDTYTELLVYTASRKCCPVRRAQIMHLCPTVYVELLK
jgi:hypothetical protein